MRRKEQERISKTLCWDSPKRSDRAIDPVPSSDGANVPEDVSCTKASRVVVMAEQVPANVPKDASWVSVHEGKIRVLSVTTGSLVASQVASLRVEPTTLAVSALNATRKSSRNAVLSPW